MVNENLKHIRYCLKMTASDLAKALKINRSYLYAIENGSKNLSFNLIQEYSKIIKIPVYELIYLLTYQPYKSDYVEPVSEFTTKCRNFINWYNNDTKKRENNNSLKNG